MGEVGFRDKFIAFVDIIGFKNLVRRAEAGDGIQASDLRSYLLCLGGEADRRNLLKFGPITCPQSSYIERSLDFQITQVSDCVIVSAEISPAGAINLIAHCWRAALNLLTKGLMVRGYVTRGSILHSGNEFMGSGYLQAIERESNVTAFRKIANERGTPFVEVDRAVSTYLAQDGDACTKEMFGRLTRGDGEVTAIFPFQRLSHSFGIGGPVQTFDPTREKASNDVMRQAIADFKAHVLSFVEGADDRARSKAAHYVAALDAQIQICDETDEAIDMLSQPYPARRMRVIRRDKQ